MPFSQNLVPRDLSSLRPSAALCLCLRLMTFHQFLESFAETQGFAVFVMRPVFASDKCCCSFGNRFTSLFEWSVFTWLSIKLLLLFVTRLRRLRISPCERSFSRN